MVAGLRGGAGMDSLSSSVDLHAAAACRQGFRRANQMQGGRRSFLYYSASETYGRCGIGVYRGYFFLSLSGA